MEAINLAPAPRKSNRRIADGPTVTGWPLPMPGTTHEVSFHPSAPRYLSKSCSNSLSAEHVLRSDAV